MQLVPMLFYCLLSSGNWLAQYLMIMKKVICFLFVCALSIGSFSYASESNSITTIEQQDKWEELGSVKLVNEYWGIDAILYVRIIEKSKFYRVKIDGKYYSVAIGEYFLKGKKYNAKAGDYYFNI